MFQLNKKILEILKEITIESPNFIVKGGSSLLIRNYYLEIEDYRASRDIDITSLGYKKGLGPTSQYKPTEFNLRDFLISREIEFEEIANNNRRITFVFFVENEKIELETSVPSYEEYEEFDLIGDIRIAKLYKVFSDKLMILIEYHAIGKDLYGEYLRHLIDIMLMEEKYNFSIKGEIDNIVRTIKNRINYYSKFESKKVIYDDLQENFEMLISEFVGSSKNKYEFINSKIYEHPYFSADIKNVVTKARLNRLREVINNV